MCITLRTLNYGNYGLFLIQFFFMVVVALAIVAVMGDEH